jgi:hypothetical protein
VGEVRGVVALFGIGGGGVSLGLRGRVCAGCVGGCMVCGSETWPVKKGRGTGLEEAGVGVVRRVCGVSLGDRGAGSQLGDRVGWKL